MEVLSESQDFERYRDKGSTEALARVFDAVAPRLLLLAAHLTSDTAQAEDLVQIAFLHGMRDAASWDGERPVAAWFAGILNHRALDLRRRSALRSHEPLGDGITVELDPAELVADQELMERVVAEIEGIESPYREVLSLRVVHGMPATTIAHTLGRAPGTVRMQLKRGLERLRAGMPDRSAFLGVFLLESGSGLDVVKEAVLAKAGIGAGVAVATVPVSTGIVGGLIVMKATVITIAALLLSALLYTLFGQEEARREGVLGAPAIREVRLHGEDGGAPEPPLVAATVEDQREAMEPAAEADVAPLERSVFSAFVRYESDGAPAVDVGVYVRAASGEGLGFESRTNDEGLVFFEELGDARHLLHVDRLEGSIVFDSVREGPLEVLIPEGLEVHGRVLDLEGQPVAGAHVMRLNQKHHDVLQAVATTDGDGRFKIRDVTAGTEFLARVEGFQPSELGTVREGRSAEFELIMGARGHLLTGRVIDASGEPVPRAWVAIGVDEDAREELQGSRVQPLLKRRRKAMDLEGLLLRADENGEFESREVPAGYVLVIARPLDSRSELIGFETLWIQYGAEVDITIQLRRGALVEGVLKDSTGRPLAGTQMEAEWEGTPALGQMEDDLGPLMTDRRCLSAADGSFRLVGLLAGDYDLRASGARERLVKAERMIGENEIVQWNPVVKRQVDLSLRLLVAPAR